MTQWTTSRAQRRIVGRLDRGASLLDEVHAQAKQHSVHAGRVGAFGSVDDATLALFDPERGEFVGAQVLRGPSAVMQFEGRIALTDGVPRMTAHVVLARGAQLVAGQIVSARVASLEIVIECWDDVVAEQPAREESPVETVAAIAEPPHSLAEVARALESMPERFESEETHGEPEPGDLFDHPSFGIVEFEAEADGGRARIKLSTGSRREIMLEVFDVLPREPIRGKRCFVLRPRRR